MPHARQDHGCWPAAPGGHGHETRFAGAGDRGIAGAGAEDHWKTRLRLCFTEIEIETYQNCTKIKYSDRNDADIVIGKMIWEIVNKMSNYRKQCREKVFQGSMVRPWLGHG